MFHIVVEEFYLISYFVTELYSVTMLLKVLGLGRTWMPKQQPTILNLFYLLS